MHSKYNLICNKIFLTKYFVFKIDTLTFRSKASFTKKSIIPTIFRSSGFSCLARVNCVLQSSRISSRLHLSRVIGGVYTKFKLEIGGMFGIDMSPRL